MASMRNISFQRRVIDQVMKSQIYHQHHGHRQHITTIVQRSLSTTLTTPSSTNTNIHTINAFNHQKCHPKRTIAEIKNFSTEVVQATTNSTSNDASNNTTTTTSTNNDDTKTKKGKTNIDLSRLIPTRHSSKNAPSIAPVDILDNATDKILKSIPGTLFAYDQKYLELNKEEEYEKGLEISHYHQEHVEYLLRGYSSLLPSSLVHLQESSVATTTSSSKEQKSDTIAMKNQSTWQAGMSGNNNNGKLEEIVDKMIQLIARMEEEGRSYVELRSKLRSQLMNVNQRRQQQQQSEENDSNIEGIENKVESSLNESAETSRQNWQLTQLIHHYGAPPGPSIVMYDLVLDAIANIITHSSNPALYLRKVRALHRSALERNELDREQKMDSLNVQSVPTPATFNAMIRASSLVDTNKHHGNEEVRDLAVENAFLGYDAMFHHNVIQRNSATYKYMVRTVNKFFPDCEAKGYILVALWDKCTLQEQLLDEDIVQAFLEVNSEDCGDKFHPWMTKEIKDVFDEKENGYGFPQKYSKNKKMRRYDRNLDIY